MERFVADAAGELTLGDEWIKETSSNGSFFWRHKITDDIKWDPSSLAESSSLSAAVRHAALCSIVE